VIALAEGNGSVAAACFERYRNRLARGLAAIVNVLDPEKIVLGSGLSNIAQLCEALPAQIERYAFSDAIDTPIVPRGMAIRAACAALPGCGRPTEPSPTGASRSGA
jgi:fructokinase